MRFERVLSVEERYDNPEIPHLTARDRRWLRRAQRIAELLDGRWKVGCVIVRGNRLLAVAGNTPRNDPHVVDGRLWCVSVHAEMAALRQVSDPRGATAYVARVGLDGTVRHAQPCSRCRHALDRAGVRAIWTADRSYVDGRRPPADSRYTHIA